MSKKLEDFLAGKRSEGLASEPLVIHIAHQAGDTLTMHRTKERPAPQPGDKHHFKVDFNDLMSNAILDPFGGKGGARGAMFIDRLKDTPKASFAIDKMEVQPDGTVIGKVREIPVKLNDEVIGSARAVISETGLVQGEITITDQTDIIDKLMQPEPVSFGTGIFGKIASQEITGGPDGKLHVNHFENGGISWDYVSGPGIASTARGLTNADGEPVIPVEIPKFTTEVVGEDGEAVKTTLHPEFWGHRILGGNKHRSLNPEAAKQLWAKPDGGTFFMLVETMLDDDNVIWGRFDIPEFKMHVRRLVSQMKQVPGMFPRTVLTAINQIKAALTTSQNSGRVGASFEKKPPTPVFLSTLKELGEAGKSEEEIYDMANRIFTDAAKTIAMQPPRYINMTLENLVAQFRELGFEALPVQQAYLSHKAKK